MNSIKEDSFVVLDTEIEGKFRQISQLYKLPSFMIIYFRYWRSLSNVAKPRKYFALTNMNI